MNEEYRLFAVLRRLKELPIKWDRRNKLAIYGWIDGTDGKRDFVVLIVSKEKGFEVVDLFITSSVKYSVEITKLIMGRYYDSEEDHLPCEKFDVNEYIKKNMERLKSKKY